MAAFDIPGIVAAAQQVHLMRNRKGGWAARTDPKDDEEMKMALVNTHRVEGSSVSQWMGDVLARWNEARERRAVYLRTLEELDSMSDRDLADINLARVQIEDIARQAAYGK